MENHTLTCRQWSSSRLLLLLLLLQLLLLQLLLLLLLHWWLWSSLVNDRAGVSGIALLHRMGSWTKKSFTHSIITKHIVSAFHTWSDCLLWSHCRSTLWLDHPRTVERLRSHVVRDLRGHTRQVR